MSGFLPYKATFMLDFVLVAILLVVPILIFGLLQAFKKNYVLHAKTMIFLGGLVLLVVGAFEIDMRLHGGIGPIMEKAGRKAADTPFFNQLLNIHLCFAISTCILWVYTTVMAIKKFGLSSPQPNSYSKTHKILGKITTFDVVGVAITGTMVYYYAFIKAIN